ncbi:MAG: hypothetical protein A3G18_04735 [Rhodospirillales bacterium RIFCSPLOWO2_12_FULL_58_28]|nr:MAG: hypothetical protein A3H92_09525 [Rhodospirillales bacterium RIFCSPLOWO2_02_FULL_58_16]OHC76946.1 MAG: hypothetical protein A3G18_04735 [Rhodospirillales bacterium RIFCSPLOWO2_12_FULL_58_28]
MEKESMFRFSRLSAFVVFPLFLSGCGIEMQVAALVADGISLFATEKTIADHGISAVAAKDCAVWRGVSGGEFCQDNGTAVAKVVKVANEGDEWDGGPEDKSVPVEVVDSRPARPAAPSAPKITPGTVLVSALEPEFEARFAAMSAAAPDAKPAPEPAIASESGGLHFVLASFAAPGNAERMARRNSGLSARVVAATVGRRTVHRVVVGPLTPEDAKALRPRLESAGFNAAWALNIDAGPQSYQLAALR